MPTTTMPKKASKSESGHAKNAANFGALITTIEGYGASYKPTLAAISVAKLKALKQEIYKSLKSVSAAESPYKSAVNQRQAAFDGMSKLATRVLNALEVVGSDKEIADARGIVKRIRGEGKAKATPRRGSERALAPTVLPQASAQAEKAHSTSQMSYVNRVKNFEALVDILNGIPAYKPNEADLKTAAINLYLDSLPALDDVVTKAAVALHKARAVRDSLLYGNSGAMALGQKVKSYLKSIYGAASVEYKRIVKIELKDR